MESFIKAQRYGVVRRFQQYKGLQGSTFLKVMIKIILKDDEAVEVWMNYVLIIIWEYIN